MKIIVLSGGNSPERDVSLDSGEAVCRALASVGHEVQSRVIDSVEDVLEMNDLLDVDVVFPALHGGAGEDGTLQGMLALKGVVFALSGMTPSAIAMNKDATKRIMRGADIPTPDWLLVSWDLESNCPDSLQDNGGPRDGYLCLEKLQKKVEDELGLPVVIKPVADGSSSGVEIVKLPEQFATSFNNAAKSKQPVLIEKYIPGRELTAAIMMGRRLPLVEIIPKAGFYDYANKYTPGNSDYACPAPVGSPMYEQMSRDAQRLYDLIGCSGVARVDFRLDGDTYSCLEINTIPGMTDTSLVPKAAAAVGISFSDLLVDICEEAISHRR
ncbi:D-alanine--D-alanine ligase [bacterium]|nr:D-alanine--D-alanine ligase [bacterium]